MSNPFRSATKYVEPGMMVVCRIATKAIPRDALCQVTDVFYNPDQTKCMIQWGRDREVVDVEYLDVDTRM